MNDKELLELAAKAYGFGEKFGVTWTETEYPLNSGVHGALWNGFGHGETAELWNPLTDDGDALRLAVKLQLHVDANDVDCTVFVHQSYHKKIKFGKDEHGTPIKCFMIIEKYGDDPYRATRLAIVQASAKLGRLMG